MVNKTFAIITDIHSNISALSEAMKIIKSRDNIDQIICLGDCFSLGPEPEKTLEKLKAREISPTSLQKMLSVVRHMCVALALTLVGPLWFSLRPFRHTQ